MAHYGQSAQPLEMISPFAMPPPQYDTIPPGLSEQFAQSQILRRLSSKSSTTPNGSRRASARIVKGGGLGNSPHNIQRRRTTAAHRVGEFTRSLHDNTYLTREQRLWNYNQARQVPQDVRPFSWHPGYEGSVHSQEPVHSNELAIGNTIAGLENLAVNNTPPSSVQESIHNAFTMGYGFPVGMEAPQHASQLDRHLEYGQAPQYMIYPNPVCQNTRYSIYHDTQWQQSYGSTSNDIAAFSGPTAVPPQPSNDSSYAHNKGQLIPVEDEGEELIGIGLYDKEDDVAPILTSTVHEVSPQVKAGKDLKLEETWQPPEDADDDDESSVEAEEIDELHPAAPAASDSPTAFFPPYGDLSDQTFFLDDNDDAYVGKDQFPEYLGLDYNNGWQAKPQPAASGNIFWF